MKYPNELPPLAFGRDRTLEFDNPEALAAVLSSGGRARLAYRRIDTDTPFLSRSSEIRTSHARIVASASSAVEVDAEAPSSTGILLLPLHGSTVTRYGGRDVEWGLAQGPAYLPSDRCTATTTERSAASIDIDPTIIKPMIHTMLGDPGARRISEALDYRTPRLVSEGRRDHLDVAKLLLHQIASFDHLNGDAQLVERSGLDDVILRMSILMLWPELLATDVERRQSNRRAVNLTCDYVDANLAKRITLTDLERISGLSARSLQYAFRSAFGCTPMQWVTRRRLEAVRSRILLAQEGDSLTTIAGEYFNNLGDFSRHYRLRYGELPSRTLHDVLTRRF